MTPHYVLGNRANKEKRASNTKVQKVLSTHNELKPTLMVAVAVTPHAFPTTQSAVVHCFPTRFLFLTYALSLN